MELEEFRQDTLQAAWLGAAADGQYDSIEYVRFVVDDLIECQECTDYTPCHHESVDKKGKKIEIFGYNYDEDDDTLSIFSCVFDGGDVAPVLSKADINKSFQKAKAFVQASFTGAMQDNTDESSPAHELATFISEIKDKIERYRFYIITDGEKSERIKTLDAEPIEGKPVIISLWDISNYFDLKVSKMGYNDLEIKFSDFGSAGVQCLKANEKVAGCEYDAYLCVMPGTLLSKLYEKYGARLLESNVRSFLKLTTRTNKAIRATMLKEPHMFFAYNNGITTTATEVKVEDKFDGKYLTGVTSLQIVNGGQTTATIYTVGRSPDKPDLEAIYVPMKISVIPARIAEDIVPKISRSANTQNKVSEADFFSNHRFHIVMETHSRTIRAPAHGGDAYKTRWFYERARGQYQQEQARLTPSQKKQFLLENPRGQYFTKTDLAKYRNSYDKRPDIVSQGAQASFIQYAKYISEAFEKNPEEFNEDYFKESVALAILFRQMEKIVTDQPWYNGGYRANIVTYSIAKLAEMIEDSGNRLDLIKIWNEQTLDDVLRQQMILISGEIYNSLTAENSVVQNVTQWCKKSACWERVKILKINTLPGIEKCYISARKERSDKRKRSQIERELMKMNARIEVVNAGSRYWRELYFWGLDHNLLNFDEKECLKTAFNIENGHLPTESQSKLMIKIRDRLREDGYKK